MSVAPNAPSRAKKGASENLVLAAIFCASWFFPIFQSSHRKITSHPVARIQALLLAMPKLVAVLCAWYMGKNTMRNQHNVHALIFQHDFLPAASPRFMASISSSTSRFPEAANAVENTVRREASGTSRPPQTEFCRNFRPIAYKDTTDATHRTVACMFSCGVPSCLFTRGSFRSSSLSVGYFYRGFPLLRSPCSLPFTPFLPRRNLQSRAHLSPPQSFAIPTSFPSTNGLTPPFLWREETPWVWKGLG